mmetsp:Transcript_55614/g.120074  ORF Transcript_55614/g.120074 Transcript_55614/m.120074 type:complete len:972 (+) Transcript_55614:56-2971(+)|eukprot:CAMPEP_0170595530 /NCGR_PEP_ID=MMETSP0224-20130122/14615_1 /TAXON_ID=285029 /ORGANISM="Togula jolla, Strain CCCM 725" /LENGTH=971 /DNA_ID=CAMNT_0010919725 /DNA_START=45 /DNA_END=2960 /DNA_ORIENTATION=-
MPYAEIIQDNLAKIFVSVVRESHPEAADALDRKLKLVSSSGVLELSRRDSYEKQLDIFNGLSGDLKLKVAEMDAKLIDVQWRSRKTAGIRVVNALNALGTVRTGDTFDEVIERFCRLNLPAATVQELVKYAVVWPSLTTHPTNPFSFEYTSAGIELDALLSEEVTSLEKLKAQLRVIRDTSMFFDKDDAGQSVLKKKSPYLEGQELLKILNVIYDVASPLTTRLRSALDRFNYKSVTVPETVLDINVWGPGDGDGNPNVTAAILEDFVQVLRKNVRQRYTWDLTALFEPTPERDALVAKLKDLNQADDDVTSAFQEFLNTRPASADVSRMRAKLTNFGMYLAKIDVRHNSEDLMGTFAALLKAGGVVDKPGFLDDVVTPQEQAEMVRAKMSDVAFMQKVKALPTGMPELTAALGGDEMAARVFARLRVVCKYPCMFSKLIIAETRSAANALVAMFLLTLAGGAEKSRVAIVPLFESRADLLAAPRTAHILCTDPTFLAHVEHIGHFMIMIAKSDTTRLSGPGVTGCQEETIGRLLSMNPASYGGKFAVHVFIGGGDDQMRGGGRIVEIPHVVMLAARRSGATQGCKVAMTVQGYQMQLVFGSQLLAGHFSEAFAAQQMLANARITGSHPYRAVPAVCNKRGAEDQANQFFQACMDAYEEVAGLPEGTPAQIARRKAIVDYFASFPLDLVKLGNKSSRPGSRKANPDPLQGRAISLDQLSKHDGAYITATLGVAKGFAHLNQLLRCGAPEEGDPKVHADSPEVLYLSPARHAYLANKTFRDFARMQAVVLYQKDFDVAWGHRGGVPTASERAQLEEEYQASLRKQQPASPRAFLAHIEANDMREARYLLEALTGEDHSSNGREVDLCEPLQTGWPQLARSMEYRRRQSGMATMFENEAAALFAALKSDSPPLELSQELMAYYGYVGANPKYQTPNFSLTMTDPQKETATRLVEEALAESESPLELPAWISAL